MVTLSKGRNRVLAIKIPKNSAIPPPLGIGFA
jgi:hypothetical protein